MSESIPMGECPFGPGLKRRVWSTLRRFVLLNRLDGMANHGLELLRRALARVGEVDLVMKASASEVGRIALLGCACVHGVYGRRLAVVRPGVHALNA